MQTKLNNSQAVEENLSWYQVPVVWVAVGVFMMFLAACIHIVVISRGLETPEQDGQSSVFRMPLHSGMENPEPDASTPP